MRYKNKKFLSELWLEEYDGKDGMCLVCIKNSGFIETRDGTRHCICPNGRTIKAIIDNYKKP